MSQLIIEDDLRSHLQEISEGCSTSYATVIFIDRKTVMLIKKTVISLALFDRNDCEEVKKHITNYQPAIILMRLDKFSNSATWALILWLPDECKLKDSLIYTAAKKIIRNALIKIFPLYELAINSPEKLTYENCIKEIQKEKQFISGLTLLERRKTIEEIIKLSLPVCKVLLPMASIVLTYKFYKSTESFKDPSNDVNCVLLHMENSGEVMGFTVENVSPGTLGEVLQGTCQYCLLRYMERIVFILICLDGSSRSQRLMYAACKGAVSNAVSSQGINIWRNFDLRNLSDFGDNIFHEEIEDGYLLPMSLASKPLPPSIAFKKNIVSPCEAFFK